MSEVFYIGITGRAGAGKDTAAAIMADYLAHRIKRCSVDVLPLALRLKQAVKSLFMISTYQMENRSHKEAVLENYDLAPRQLLQKLGSAIRTEFGEDIFTKLVDIAVSAEQTLSPIGIIIVPDIRYQNEAKWLLSKPNSMLVVITRGGDEAGTKFAHASEDGIDLMDLMSPDKIYHVDNNGSLQDFEYLVERLAAKVVDVNIQS